MIFIGIGANLPSISGSPRQTCERAVEALAATGLRIVARSRWYGSAPVPASDQPWYVNGVIAVETGSNPIQLLEILHRVETAFGRVRRDRNEARVLDLDLLAFDGVVARGPDGPILPHPRLHERAFVLLPLAELAPQWCHPDSGESIATLIARLDHGQQTQVLGAAPIRS